MPEKHLEKRGQSMAYKLNVTEHADVRLEINPYQYLECRDTYLAKKGYREAVVPQMNYIVIFDVKADVVNIVGIFHQLENYQSKL